MLQNLCVIGEKIYTNKRLNLKYSPFIKPKRWAVDEKKNPLPKLVLNLPVDYDSNKSLKIAFDKAYFGEDENEIYYYWNAQYNPNDGNGAVWVDGDIDSLKFVDVKTTKLKKAQYVATTYFPAGVYDEVVNNLDKINSLLGKFTNYLIHFVYPDKKPWYEQTTVKAGFEKFIRTELLKKVVKKGDTYVVPVYNYLSSVLEGNFQAPDFDNDNIYKNISFTGEDAIETGVHFFWGQQFYTKIFMKIRGKYDLRVLPDATNLTANQIDSFFTSVSIQAAEKALKPLNAGGLRKLLTLNSDKSDNLRDISFSATIFVATSTFTSKEVLSFNNLSNSYLTRKITAWRNTMQDLQKTSEWSHSKFPVEYSVWGNVWNDTEKRFDELGVVQMLFAHEKYDSLYPKMLYQLLTDTFRYENLIGLFLETLHEKALKGGLKVDSHYTAINEAVKLKNAFLILNSLQMGNTKVNGFLESPSFKLGIALGNLLNLTIDKANSKYRYPNLVSRVYEVAGNIKRNTGSARDVAMIASDIYSRMLRNHSESKPHDSRLLRLKAKDVNDAIENLTAYNSDEVALGFYWEFLKVYPAKATDSVLTENVQVLENEKVA